MFTNIYDGIFKGTSWRFFGKDFDWKWFKAQGIAESNLVEKAISPVGAMGLMQVMPKTFEDIKKKVSWLKDINNPVDNVAAGIYYDKYLFDVWMAERPLIDRLCFMFASYNAGLGNILKAQSVCNASAIGNCNLWSNIEKVADKINTWKSEETLGYIKRILNMKKLIDSGIEE